jgi:hypothetical protein
MTMIAKADKSRLTIRGVQDGREYLVKQEGTGWWVEPAPENSSSRKRELSRATRDLSEHLNALADEGFSFEPAPKENVPPCRF